MKTFIRAIEYWAHDDASDMLKFGGGLFGDAAVLASANAGLSFARGEGLPGRAWDTGRPIVLQQLEGSYFRRAEAARAAGLTCGIAVPIFRGKRIAAVVVFFCGDDDAHAGAIELWGNDPEESHDMTLVDGYYGTTGDTFEFISRAIAFRKGNGLPGMAWAQHKPVFLPDLGKGSGFLRADGAVKVGINRGFAIPCSTLDGSNFVMAFLSALATPIARRVETWEPDATAAVLQRTFGFSEDTQDAAAPTPGSIALTLACNNLLAHAFVTGVPCVDGTAIAIPVAPRGRVTAVITLQL